jgi:hypothetical protein
MEQMMKTLAVISLLACSLAAPASAQSNGGPSGFFGGSTIPVCYWYPHACKNGTIIVSQPVRTSKIKRARK